MQASIPRESENGLLGPPPRGPLAWLGTGTARVVAELAPSQRYTVVLGLVFAGLFLVFGLPRDLAGARAIAATVQAAPTTAGAGRQPQSSPALLPSTEAAGGGGGYSAGPAASGPASGGGPESAAPARPSVEGSAGSDTGSGGAAQPPSSATTSPAGPPGSGSPSCTGDAGLPVPVAGTAVAGLSSVQSAVGQASGQQPPDLAGTVGGAGGCSASAKGLVDSWPDLLARMAASDLGVVQWELLVSVP